MKRRARLLLLGVVAVAGLSSCAVPDVAAPRCRADQRLGAVAQAVPTASYVPCVDSLAAGWSIESFDVRAGRVSMTLQSDREPRPVQVELRTACDVAGATAVAPRAVGVRTYLRIQTIDPRYVGTIVDLFPGGCVTYGFDFARGPHITLTDELRAAVSLYPRHDLRRELQAKYGINLDG